MKRNILLAAALCLALVASAQKPKRSFSTVNPPFAGTQWQTGEKISLPDGDNPQGVLYNAENAGDKTYFSGRGACRAEDGRWVALYPASALRMWDPEYLYFNIPHVQLVNADNKPMFNRTDVVSFDFKPLTAYLTFTLAPDAPPVKEVRVSTNKFISGSYKVELAAKSLSVLLDTGERFREIVLKPEKDGGVIAPGDYTMSIYARSLPDGMTVEVLAEDGSIAVRKITSEVKFSLGKTRDIGVITKSHFIDPSRSMVGTVFGNQGVVFWVDPENPLNGKAVAANADVSAWAGQNDLYGIHTFKDNYEKVYSVVSALPAYQADPESFRAVWACEQMRKTCGGNWHVPSVTEMKLLFNAYYGHADAPLPEKGSEYTDSLSLEAAGRFDAAMKSIGGEGMLERSHEYWICGQNSNGNMQYVGLKQFYNGNAVQTAQKYVRCIRDFSIDEIDGADAGPKTDAGKILEGDSSSKVNDVIEDTAFVVAPGLDYYQMKIVTDAFEKMDFYLLRLDPSKGLDLRVAISDETTSSEWVRQAPSAMAAHMDAPSAPVYAIVNADFCDNRIPIRPRGPVHCNGKVWSSSYSIDPKFTQQALSYVGVDYDGNVIIAPSAGYAAARKTLKECTGAGVILLQDSEIQGGFVNSPSRDPRTAIGYTPDNVVWILMADGRHKGVKGMTYLEMASIFKALGCEAAVNLDGGGSSQMLVKDPQTGRLEMRNWPSDPHIGFGGRERPRLNGWVIMKSSAAE